MVNLISKSYFNSIKVQLERMGERMPDYRDDISIP